MGIPRNKVFEDAFRVQLPNASVNDEAREETKESTSFCEVVTVGSVNLNIRVRDSHAIDGDVRDLFWVTSRQSDDTEAPRGLGELDLVRELAVGLSDDAERSCLYAREIKVDGYGLRFERFSLENIDLAAYSLPNAVL